MKNSIFHIAFLLLISFTAGHSFGSANRYAGGDISLLPEYETAGAVYKTPEGEPIPDILPWLHNQGMNAMRVRLFVNPDDYTASDKDPNACQNLEYIIPLCKRIKDTGMALMLDFHYSDTWADPEKQWIPKSWEGLADTELYQKIYDYTKESLLTLKQSGITPDFIQPGNEISFGMLWGAKDDPENELKKTFMGNEQNWERLGHLLSNAIKACREECPEAGIVIHTERIADLAVEQNFYDHMSSLNIDYDIIGLSYYPYFHGNLSTLEKSLSMLENRYPSKQIMIVETGYSYKWEVPGTSQPVDYTYSEEGQYEFARDLVNLLLRHPSVTGLFWWWMEYNANGTSLSNWYNAPLFDSTDGHACKALKTICSFATPQAGIHSLQIKPHIALPSASSPWYELSGQPVITNPRKGEIYITPQGCILY